MQAALAHTFMLIFAAGAARLGWFMAQEPQSASRLFTFGAEPAFGKRFVLSFCRTVGWFFTISGTLGVTLYLVLITLEISHSH